MAEERPTAAFVLALIAAIFHIIGGLIVISFGGLFIALFLPEIGIAIIASAIVIMALAIWGAVWLYTTDQKRATYGGVITLVVAIVALPTVWGVIIGSILGLIGGILGIVWKPSMAMPAAPMPAAPAAPPTPAPPAPEPEPPAPEPPAEESAEEE